MSPIYTRPIREQLEHDRVIRQLQARYKRKHEVAINPGAEQNQSVTVGDMTLYPDLVLLSLERTRHLEATIEVETGESVHLLEARAEWGAFARLPAPLFLYVPPQAVETARRICDDQQIPVTEIWTYHMTFDQVRFTQVYKSPNPVKVVPPPPVKAAPASKAAPAGKAKPASPTAPGKAAKAAPPAKANGGKSANAPKASPAKAVAKSVVKPASKAVKPVKPVAKAAAKPVRPAKAASASKGGKPVKAVAKPKGQAAKKVAAAKKRR